MDRIVSLMFTFTFNRTEIKMEVTRVFDLLSYCDQQYGLPDMLAFKQAAGWKKFSSSQVLQEVNAVSLGLLDKGIRKHDKVAIMSANRPEWNFLDMGINQLGAVTVPLYPTLSTKDLAFIARDADIKMFFVENADLFEKLRTVLTEAGIAAEVYTFEQVSGAVHYSELQRTPSAEEMAILDALKEAVMPADLLTLIYTSGTTGDPKGVMLSHDNLISNVKASASLAPAGTKRSLSFLPLSHVFERMVNYLEMYSGISIYYAENMDTIVANLNEVHPNIFSTVPRLLEKVYDKIVSKGKELKGLKRTIFFWALELGHRFEPEGQNGWFYEVQLGIARKLVFVKWKEALGGEMMAIVSGGAALQPRLARVFTAAGIPIMEGYGLTETSPVISVNTTHKNCLRFGSVGRVIAGDSVRIAADGEILVKGPNIMLGYYNQPEKTSEAIDADGFFHTGDIGELDGDGFLKITDRKKEMFKTSGGKYISPGVLENKFKESPFIEQMMVTGEGERFPAALIVPAFEHLRSWASIKGISVGTNEQMVLNAAVLEKYTREIAQYNSGFGHWEQIKKFVLLPREWSIDGGEMTPKLSIRRKIILDKYRKEVASIYENSFVQNK